MADPFLGEIRMFGGNFPPVGWAFCNGAVQDISQNAALFQLIGTTYGGDGQTTFNLPDLQGRAPMHMGQGPGITQTYVIGQKLGVESVTLTAQQIPAHNHSMQASTDAANQITGKDGVLAATSQLNVYFATTTPDQTLNAGSVQAAGGSQPHENMMPFLCISFIIAVNGIFPTQ